MRARAKQSPGGRCPRNSEPSSGESHTWERLFSTIMPTQHRASSGLRESWLCRWTAQHVMACSLSREDNAGLELYGCGRTNVPPCAKRTRRYALPVGIANREGGLAPFPSIRTSSVLGMVSAVARPPLTWHMWSARPWITMVGTLKRRRLSVRSPEATVATARCEVPRSGHRRGLLERQFRFHRLDTRESPRNARGRGFAQ